MNERGYSNESEINPQWKIETLEAEKSKLEERVETLEKQNQELFDMAYKDSLTGLWNRNGLKMLLEKSNQQQLIETDPSRRKKLKDKNISLLILDIDRFKSINDEYGHPVGDEVLSAIGKALQQEVRATDIVARWGGEEIVIVFKGTDENGILQKFFTRTTEDEQNDHPGKPRFNRTIDVEGKALQVTLSGGVTSFDPNSESYDEAFKRADLALYKAKGNSEPEGQGRDRILGTEQLKKQELKESLK